MSVNFASGKRERGMSPGRTKWGVLPLFVVALFLATGFVYGFRSYADIAEAPPAFDAGIGNVKPESAIAISFLSPVKTDRYIEGVSLHPVVPVTFEWTEGDTKLLIHPKSRWASAEHYTVSLSEGRTTWLGKIPATTFTFETWKPPRILSVSPENGAKDVLLGAEDPIVVTLDRSAKDSFFDFSFHNTDAVLYEIDPNKEEFRILPRDIRAGTRYELTVRVRPREGSDATFETIYSGSFETMPPAPAEWARDFPTRLEQAKRYTLPLRTTGKYIDINVRHQVMVIFEEGKALDSFLVSSGKRGMDTPKGEFSIHNKAPRPWSKTYSLYMPYWMAITSDGKFGIHELPEWPGGYKEGANHLGTPVSHGCVRLGIGFAKRVYEWADIGTPVVVH